MGDIGDVVCDWMDEHAVAGWASGGDNGRDSHGVSGAGSVVVVGKDMKTDMDQYIRVLSRLWLPSPRLPEWVREKMGPVEFREMVVDSWKKMILQEAPVSEEENDGH